MSDRAPDVIGEIIGWRAWKVVGTAPEKLPLLASVTYGHTIWHPGYWTEADCRGSSYCGRSTDGRTPGERCTCGLYAAAHRTQLVGLRYGEEKHDSRWPKVVGEVGLVGKVIPGTQGWRAEKGRIVRLYVPFAHWRLVDPLEELYGVPVQLDNTMNVNATDWSFGEEQ